MTDKKIVEPKVLFCKQCMGVKVRDREYCCYCVGRHEVKNRPLRVRFACWLLPHQLKMWFIFHIGYERQYKQLIPEHLWVAEWLTMGQVNAPRMDEE
jgi:hypothetical protein